VLTRLLAVAASVVLLPSLAACGGSSSSATAEEPSAATPSDTGSASASASATTCDYPADPEGAAKRVDPPPAKPTVSGTVDATIETSVGTLAATLDADKAPCTVSSFVSLADQGYFDDTPCHRLTTAASQFFVLQCGDPTGTGTGGPGYTIPDELSGNETYGPGTIAMAKTDQPNSGGSQFFIVYESSPLPSDYTVFGQLSPASLKVVQQVAAKGSDNAFNDGDGHPKEKVTITEVTTR
jgi:peptidyl-prolyl cis-trans isomerase B (cyclophilin B)